MVILKNWSVCQRGNEWMAPELRTNYLQGNVYGHPRFSDGDPVSTSSIENISNGDGCKIVKTRNTEYVLYKDDVSAEYELLYPGAYTRLSITKGDLNDQAQNN